MECYFAEVAAAEQVSSVADAFTELGRQVDAVRRRKPTSSSGGGGGGSGSSLLDRMLLGTRSGASIGSIRAYARGKSDSALPKDCHWSFSISNRPNFIDSKSNCLIFIGIFHVGITYLTVLFKCRVAALHYDGLLHCWYYLSVFHWMRLFDRLQRCLLIHTRDLFSWFWRHDFGWIQMYLMINVCDDCDYMNIETIVESRNSFEYVKWQRCARSKELSVEGWKLELKNQRGISKSGRS